MTTRAFHGQGAPRRGSGCVALQRMQDAGLGPLGWLAPVYRGCVGGEDAAFAEFVARRIAEDPRMQHRLLRCRTAADLHALQAAFLDDAAAAYNARTGANVQIGKAARAAAAARAVEMAH
jgi:hypothetical protein